MTKTRMIMLAAVAASAFGAAETFAQGRGPRDGSGPVGTACASDMGKYCAGMQHGDRSMRNCLEANRAKVSKACKSALDSTGGGRGRR